MKEFRFKCPNCGTEDHLVEVIKNVIAFARIRVVKYDSCACAEIEELDCDSDMDGARSYICGYCDFDLPGNTQEDFIDYVIHQNEVTK